MATFQRNGRDEWPPDPIIYLRMLPSGRLFLLSGLDDVALLGAELGCMRHGVATLGDI